MNIIDLINSLDLENFDYFYHATELSNAKKIINEGLLVNGTNIIGVDNIAFTTIAPFYLSDLESPENFADFIISERSDSAVRTISAFVIIGASKDEHANVVSPYNQYVGTEFFEGIIPTDYIIGFVNANNLSVTLNEDYHYLDEMMERTDYSI